MASLISFLLAIPFLYADVAPYPPYYPDDNITTAIILFISLAFAIVLLVVYIITAIFMMKLFAKANVPAWKAWVPFVNFWKFLELGGYHGATSLLFVASIIPFVGFITLPIGYVLMCMAAYQIGLKLGKDGAWVVLYIFFSIIWLGILGLNKSMWNDSFGKPALGIERPPSGPFYGGGVPPQGSYPPPPQGNYPPPPPGY